jgi:hypothetical protein
MAPFPLTKLQKTFIKVIIVTNENFVTWAANAHLKEDGSPLFDLKNNALVNYVKKSALLSTQRSYQKFLDGIDSKWTPLEKSEISNLLLHLHIISPIRDLTDEEFETQRTRGQRRKTMPARGRSHNRNSKSPVPTNRATKTGDDEGDTGSKGEVSHIFKIDDGSHLRFAGTLETILGMEDEEFEEMIELAKTIKPGRNWGFNNAVLALNERMRVLGTSGTCSAYYLKLSPENADINRYRLAHLAKPHNDIILLQAPAQTSSESVDALNLYLSELDLKTEG